MESKEQFRTIIKKLSPDKYDYLNRLFENCPDYVIRSMQYARVKKNHTIIQGGSLCDTVYIIIDGRVSGIDFQPLGNVYMFKEYVSTEVLGDFELFGDIKSYRITVRAVTECGILKIPAFVYLDWMQQDIGALFMRTRKLMNMFTNEAAKERKKLFLNCSGIICTKNFFCDGSSVSEEAGSCLPGNCLEVAVNCCYLLCVSILVSKVISCDAEVSNVHAVGGCCVLESVVSFN